MRPLPHIEAPPPTGDPPSYDLLISAIGQKVEGRAAALASIGVRWRRLAASSCRKRDKTSP